MNCARCGAPLKEGFKFCQTCGADLGAPAQEVSYSDLPAGTVIVCPKCGASNFRTDTLCRNCETDLTEAKRSLAAKYGWGTAAQKVTCPFCGTVNLGGARSCSVCGRDISTPAVVPSSAGHYDDMVDLPVKLLLYVVSIIVPIVGVILGSIFYVARSDPKSDFRETGMICMFLSVINAVISLIILLAAMAS